jgi:hypothetical protein
MNVIVPIEIVVTDEEATTLASNGRLACTICNTCSAIVPLYRMVVHGQRMHPEAK